MDIKKELESIDFYQNLRRQLNKLPSDIKKIILELAKKPFWIEIGKALNSFPITEEVNKFKLKQRLEPYMRLHNISDLDFDTELSKLQQAGYTSVKIGSMPNYFCLFEFAQAIEVIEITENSFTLPLAEELKKRPEFRGYKNLEQSLGLLVYSALEV